MSDLAKKIAIRIASFVDGAFNVNDSRFMSRMICQWEEWIDEELSAKDALREFHDDECDFDAASCRNFERLNNK